MSSINKKFQQVGKFLSGFVILVVLFVFSSCMKELEQYENTDEGNFDALWSIIDTRYCYLDYKNIDWDAIYTTYSTKLKSAEGDKYALFDLFGAMLAELQDGHVNLYSNFDISRYDKWYTDSAANYYPSIITNQYIENKYFRIAGGLRYAKLKNHNIGYIYYGSFSTGFSDTNIRNVFEYFGDCSSLIIDVRDNGGGSLTYAELLASYFFTEETTTGYMMYKNGAGHSDFSKPAEVKTPAHKKIRWGRPVAILTNRYSYSATNDFVVRMKYAPNAFTVGSWTGGGGGMPLSSELPNGWMVRFSACPMLDAEMNHTEWGIAPDYHIVISDQDRDSNIDSVLEKAIGLLQ